MQSCTLFVVLRRKDAHIDGETNWTDHVVSLGISIADADTFEHMAANNHTLPIACAIGGIYQDMLFLETPVNPNFTSI